MTGRYTSTQREDRGREACGVPHRISGSEMMI